MKIAVDARELTARPTGVGRYLAELVARWSNSPAARRHEWRLYAHGRPTMPDALPATFAVLPGHGGTVWEQWTFARRLARDRPDVLFAPGYTAPLTAPCPTAVTIHDVSFSAHPEWFSFREGVRRRTLTAWSARRARVVLTDSTFSREEITRLLGVPRERVRVIPLGVTRRPRAPIEGRATTTGSSEAPEGRVPLVLFVGSIFRRRHVDCLIDAFIQSVAERVPNSRLEIVGENRSYPPVDLEERLRRAPPGIATRVTLRSYVDEPTLGDLYARATVFAFLSEYEGFGLPPLEALAMGVPPVVLDTPVAREIYGSAARYVGADLSSTHTLADAIVELMTTPSARGAVLRQADEVLARYDWSRAAAATLDAIEEAAGA